MSLINEALKKAQKQRADEESARSGQIPAPGAGEPISPTEPPPPVSPPAAPPAASPAPEPAPRARRGGGRRRSILLPVIVVVVLGAGGVWWLMWGDDSPPVELATAESTPVVSETPAQAEPVASPNPVTPAPAESTPVDTEPEREYVYDEASQPGVVKEVQQDAPASAPALEPVPAPVPQSEPQSVPVPEPAPQPQPEPVTVVFEPAPQPAAQPAAKPAPAPTPQPQPSAQPVATSRPAEGRVVILGDEAAPTVAGASATETSLTADLAVLAYLENARVTGVRASAHDPKVLMNNRVYRLNDMVSQDLRLRITGIAPRRLEFTDPRGYVYTKSF